MVTDPSRLCVAVLMGGFSSEREVSLNSGRRVTEALRGLGFRVEEVDVRDVRFQVPSATDVVFVALHGTGGEDGVVQAILEERGLAFTGSDSKSSRRAFDKVESKKVFREHGLATPADVVLRKGAKPGRVPFGFPRVVKPSREGSSIGVRIVEAESAMEEALALAFSRDDTVLVEEFIAGRELTVGILGERALPVVEIRPKSGWFDYHNKYTAGATDEIVPARIDDALARRVCDDALKAHRSLGCRDFSRADFRVDEAGRSFLLEVNTIPGLTATSLLPQAAAAEGITFPKLCLALVEQALRRKGARE